MEEGVVHVISSSSNVSDAFGLSFLPFFLVPNASFSSFALKNHN